LSLAVGPARKAPALTRDLPAGGGTSWYDLTRAVFNPAFGWCEASARGIPVPRPRGGRAEAHGQGNSGPRESWSV